MHEEMHAKEQRLPLTDQIQGSRTLEMYENVTRKNDKNSQKKTKKMKQMQVIKWCTSKMLDWCLGSSWLKSQHFFC